MWYYNIAYQQNKQIEGISMKSIFEEMGGTYTLGEDEMYYPDLELLIQQIQEQQGVNEELKSRDQMGWVGACNNIRNAAEEIVLNELIYC